MDAQTELSGASLREVLHRMGQLGESTPGPATWALQDGELTLQWMGMGDRIDGSGRGTAVALLHGDVMRRLVQALPDDELLRVAVEGKVLHLGSTQLSCERRDTVPPQLLPLNARRLDVLRLLVTQSREGLCEAGLEQAVDQASGELDAACREAAQALDWLDVGSGELREWILDRLGAGNSTDGSDGQSA